MKGGYVSKELFVWTDQFLIARAEDFILAANTAIR
jgi:hypothetical protein